METPVLSICIASYNKAELTERLVNIILGNQNEKLGVVVVDNASTDDTVERISAISDPRLKFVRNDHNIGGAANMVHTIYCGGGYCLYCNDRDIIYPDRLDALISFLEKHPDYSCGWVCRTSPKEESNYTEYETVDAFKSMCWRCEHPTGFFFNSLYLHKYSEEIWERYIRPEGWTAFPFENIQAELITKGVFVRYNIPVWHSTGNETHNKYVSSFETLKTDGDRWFYPGNCINRGKAYLGQFWEIYNANSLQIDEKTRYEIYANIILGEQKIGVWRFKQIFASDSLSYHYAVNPRKITGKEIRSNNEQIIESLISFIHDYDKSKNNYDNIITDTIKRSDRRTKRVSFIHMIASLSIVRKIRGKQS